MNAQKLLLWLIVIIIIKRAFNNVHMLHLIICLKHIIKIKKGAFLNGLKAHY